MFERFTQDARRIVNDAVTIARDLGATSVEAEHLLLAATRGDDQVAAALAAHGLSEDELASALVMETERSLAAVGVSADALTFSPYVEKPRLATSAKSAVVLAVLRPSRGTVPRALVVAGVDRDVLCDALAAVT
jgi:ATP-dependent Clp protease ATP-binding subunit ClpA